MWYKNTNTIYYSGTCQHWTRTAIECYERNMICEGCFYYETYFKNANYRAKCQMKAIVMELYRRFGKPKADEEPTRD